jgi:outer membrane protein assembly factor BamA
MGLKYFLICVLILFFVIINVRAQEINSADDSSSGTFIAMPLVNNNPVMKFSLGGIGMYMFPFSKSDTISPPSTVMLLGLYSTNNSYIFLMPTALFFGNDYYRITAAVITSRINNNFVYDYDGSDVTLVYSELRWMYIAEFSLQVINDFYTGLLYAGFLTNYRYDQGTEEQNNFTKTLFGQLGIEDNFTSSIGLKLSFDNRDYVYNATEGYNFTLRTMYFAKWLGSENEYGNVVYDFKYYHTMVPKHVIAAMLSGGNSVGDVPFSGYQVYGMRSSLRGYPTGKYRAENMLALQAEYRWNFYGRWGAVFFGGIGTLWGGEDKDTEETFEKELLPGVGVGIRFMLSEERKINARLDYAWGKDGNEGLYLSIMEAF